eukprot:2543971-Pyramimonas_sp.AAC.1
MPSEALARPGTIKAQLGLKDWPWGKGRDFRGPRPEKMQTDVACLGLVRGSGRPRSARSERAGQCWGGPCGPAPEATPARGHSSTDRPP